MSRVWAAKFTGGLLAAAILLLGVAADCGLDDAPAVQRCVELAESPELRETWLEAAADEGIPEHVARQAWAESERDFRASAWTICLSNEGFRCRGSVDLDGLPAARTCRGPDDGGGTAVVDNPYLLNSPPGPARVPRRPEPRPAPPQVPDFERIA